ncbi:MAG TPA: hypothetical protein VFR49_15285, partial [Solirubrobacteraceae bacterium]|nr:hypothetical protein [Solirubrobacteraceae bacterium]
MRVCPACGRQNADETDFCECGEYLDWTPAPPSAPAGPPVAARPIAELRPGVPPELRPGGTAPAPADPAPAIEQTVVSRPAPRRPIEETAISRPAARRPTPPTGRPRPVASSAPEAPPRPPAQERAEPGRPPALEPRPTAASGGTVVAPPRPTGRDRRAAEPPRAEAQPADPVPTVLLSVYRARSERSAGAWPATTVAAGGRVVVFALIRNQSGIVDNYDLTVDGLPDGWWTVNPPTVYLVPLGRGEGYEQEVEVALHPPRSPEAEARVWTIHLIATSRSSGQQVAAAGASLTIEPYHELDAAVGPTLADGRLGARYQAVVVNLANAPAEVAVSLVDDEQNLGFEPDGRVVTFPAVRA